MLSSVCLVVRLYARQVVGFVWHEGGVSTRRRRQEVMSVDDGILGLCKSSNTFQLLHPIVKHSETQNDIPVLQLRKQTPTLKITSFHT